MRSLNESYFTPFPYQCTERAQLHSIENHISFYLFSFIHSFLFSFNHQVNKLCIFFILYSLMRQCGRRWKKCVQFTIIYFFFRFKSIKINWKLIINGNKYVLTVWKIDWFNSHSISNCKLFFFDCPQNDLFIFFRTNKNKVELFW